jgi:hypothetical protein
MSVLFLILLVCCLMAGAFRAIYYGGDDSEGRYKRPNPYARAEADLRRRERISRSMWAKFAPPRKDE